MITWVMVDLDHKPFKYEKPDRNLMPVFARIDIQSKPTG